MLPSREGRNPSASWEQTSLLLFFFCIFFQNWFSDHLGFHSSDLKPAWGKNVLDLYWCTNLIKSGLCSSLCSGILDQLRINNCVRKNRSTGIAGLWQQQKSFYFICSLFSQLSLYILFWQKAQLHPHVQQDFHLFMLIYFFFLISISVSFLLGILPAWQSVPAATQPSWPSASWKSFAGNLLLPTTQGASIQLPDHMLLLNLVCNFVL